MRVKKKRLSAFYAGQKSRQSHKRLRGNLGTKQQLDDAPYVPMAHYPLPQPILHLFAPHGFSGLNFAKQHIKWSIKPFILLLIPRFNGT